MPKKNELKVLFLQTFPLWGCGSGTYTRSLATEISKTEDIKTAIVCPETREKISGLKIYPLDMPFTSVFVGHPEWPVSRFYKDLTPKEISELYKSFLTSTIKAVEDFQPNIIHVQHVSILLWVANFIKLLYGINFVVTTHGTGVNVSIQNKIYIPLSREALRNARKIIAVSHESKHLLIDTFGAEFTKKTRVIPGGIHLENFPEEKSIKTINAKYKLNGKKIVLFSGRLTEEKGLNYLIEAAKNIKGDIYIIGDGPKRKNLEDQILKMKLTNVYLLGFMGDDKKNELKEFYYRSDVVILPTVVEEALGLSIVEGMAAKKPIIATRKGGIPILVKDGFNGLLIKAKNSKQISDACNRLIEDDQLRKKMGENARKSIEKNFTWHNISLKIKNVYKGTFNHLPVNEKSKI